MPCCALAACIVGQFVLAFHALRRALFGAPDETTLRNSAVEWRLDAEAAPSLAPARRPAWLKSRRAVGGLALAAVVELLIVLGGIYGVIEHFGHGAHHAAHVHAAAAPGVPE